MGLIRFFNIVNTSKEGLKSNVEFMAYNGDLWMLPQNVSTWKELEKSYKYALKEYEAGNVFPEKKKKEKVEKKPWYKKIF